MPDQVVTITIDGVEVQALRGSTLISVTDEHNIHVPRFCYHKKLSVAANCRMCLVEVEKAPKPMPACATPVMDGMVVHTKSPKAIAAQKSVMEFLLINHPLDCPICDQGGECELQDISIGFGNDVSQYTDAKRVVFDKDIGPLISTELTRCIQCTRCIRFGEEIAGMRELGATDRGDRMVIGTFIEKSVDSELSGNVIDVCPVGALTAKPSRFSARAWELIEHNSIAPHDCVGSNVSVHTFRGEVTRVVPRENEALNEVWLSDRDRYSYQGIAAEDRLQQPMLKQGNDWQNASWDDALEAAASGIKKVIEAHSADQLASWITPSATLEEHYLLQKITRGLGSGNIDHRFRQSDFSNQDADPVMPWLGMDVEALEHLKSALLIGSHIRKDQPMLAHRLRKAAVLHKAEINFVNPRAFDWHLPVANECVSSAAAMLNDLAAIAQNLGGDIPANLAEVVNAAQPNDTHKAIAESLNQEGESLVLLGNIANMHPQMTVLRQLADYIAQASNSTLGILPEANSAAAYLAGAIPHRTPAGKAADISGAHAQDLIESPRKALIIFNLEPELDSISPLKALNAAKQAEFVVLISPYISDAMKNYADVILPLSAFTETSGTHVNAEGFWQSFKGVSTPLGESRPGWKILRVLANLLNLDGFDYMSSQQVKDEVKAQCLDINLDNRITSTSSASINSNDGLMRIGDVPLYAVDSLVRRASALQQTQDADQAYVRINPQLAQNHGLFESARVKVKQADAQAEMELKIDDSIPDQCVWIPAGLQASAALGDLFGSVELEKV